MDLIIISFEGTYTPSSSTTLYTKTFDYSVQCLFGWYSTSKASVINTEMPSIMTNGDSFNQNKGKLTISDQVVTLAIVNTENTVGGYSGSVFAWVIPA